MWSDNALETLQTSVPLSEDNWGNPGIDSVEEIFKLKNLCSPPTVFFKIPGSQTVPQILFEELKYLIILYLNIKYRVSLAA